MPTKTMINNTAEPAGTAPRQAQEHPTLLEICGGSYDALVGWSIAGRGERRGSEITSAATSEDGARVLLEQDGHPGTSILVSALDATRYVRGCWVLTTGARFKAPA